MKFPPYIFSACLRSVGILEKFRILLKCSLFYTILCAGATHAHSGGFFFWISHSHEFHAKQSWIPFTFPQWFDLHDSPALTHVLQHYTSFRYSTLSVKTWTHAHCCRLRFSIPSNLTNEHPHAAKYQMQCVFFPFESACWQCFCRDIPISSRGNNITITPPGEGLRCQAKVGLLFWEEKRDAEWWIMILPKPVGCLEFRRRSLGNLGSLLLCYQLQMGLTEWYSVVVSK